MPHLTTSPFRWWQPHDDNSQWTTFQNFNLLRKTHQGVGKTLTIYFLTMFRTFILASLITVSFNVVHSQQLVDENTYKSKNGMTFKTGDELVLGYGSNFNKDFRYVVTGLNSMAGPMEGIGAPWHGRKFKIKRIKEMGNEKRGKSYYLVIGAGLMNFWVDAEAAMQFDEIVYPEEYKPKKVEVSQQTSATSVADEILKLKKMLDDGVLTKDEFEIQKKKILEKVVIKLHLN